jgi:hypothetical protein
VVTDLISKTAVGKTAAEVDSSPPPAAAAAAAEASPNSSSLDLLQEMFPSLSVSELSAVLALTNGQVERAVQILLLEEENGGSSSSSSSRPSKRVQRNSTSSTEEDDQKFLKERVVARYGFVDKKEDAKEFKPILPKEVRSAVIRFCIIQRR